MTNEASETSELFIIVTHYEKIYNNSMGDCEPHAYGVTRSDLSKSNAFPADETTKVAANVQWRPTRRHDRHRFHTQSLACDSRLVNCHCAIADRLSLAAVGDRPDMMDINS